MGTYLVNVFSLLRAKFSAVCRSIIIVVTAAVFSVTTLQATYAQDGVLVNREYECLQKNDITPDEWRDGWGSEFDIFMDSQTTNIARYNKAKEDLKNDMMFGPFSADSWTVDIISDIAQVVKTLANLARDILGLGLGPADVVYGGAAEVTEVVAIGLRDGRSIDQIVKEIQIALAKMAAVYRFRPVGGVAKTVYDLGNNLKTFHTKGQDQRKLKRMIFDLIFELDEKIEIAQKEYQAVKRQDEKWYQASMEGIRKYCRERHQEANKKDEEETLADQFEMFDSKHRAKKEETALRKQAAEAARQAQRATAEVRRQAQLARQLQAAGLSHAKETSSFWESVLNLAPIVGVAIGSVLLQHKLNKGGKSTFNNPNCGAVQQQIAAIDNQQAEIGALRNQHSGSVLGEIDKLSSLGQQARQQNTAWYQSNCR